MFTVLPCEVYVLGRVTDSNYTFGSPNDTNDVPFIRLEAHLGLTSCKPTLRLATPSHVNSLRSVQEGKLSDTLDHDQSEASQVRSYHLRSTYV